MSAQKFRVYQQLQLAAHRIQKAADRVLLEAAQITTAQAAVLSVVAREEAGGVTQRAVATQLGLNESAMTAMTSRLLHMDLLERVRQDGDARAWQLTLTRQGQLVVKQIEKPFGSINRAIESVLAPQEVARLADYLQRIGQVFQADQSAAKET
jgi:DNA-binding MarR family transcriptional regulator